MAEVKVREYVAFDLETTGLFPESDRIVEIGAVRFDHRGREWGRFQSLVHPGRRMSPAAQAIHGLSDADLADAPPASKVLPRFLDWLGPAEDSILLAHNARFDAGFLGAELARIGQPLPGHEIIDTLALARRKLPKAPNHRLDTLVHLLGLDAEGHHRALADSLVVRQLWLRLRSGTVILETYPVHDPVRGEPLPTGWEMLREAIALSQRIRMEYSGGSRGTKPREVSPRRIVHRGGIAYMVAYCHVDNFEKSFRLDRIIRYEVLVRGAVVS